jgi:hypothetical protein
VIAEMGSRLVKTTDLFSPGLEKSLKALPEWPRSIENWVKIGIEPLAGTRLCNKDIERLLDRTMGKRI